MEGGRSGDASETSPSSSPAEATSSPSASERGEPGGDSVTEGAEPMAHALHYAPGLAGEADAESL